MLKKKSSEAKYASVTAVVVVIIIIVVVETTKKLRIYPNMVFFLFLVRVEQKQNNKTPRKDLFIKFCLYSLI